MIEVKEVKGHRHDGIVYEQPSPSDMTVLGLYYFL